MPKRREPEHNLLENTLTPHQPSSHLARDFLTDLSVFQGKSVITDRFLRLIPLPSAFESCWNLTHTHNKTVMNRLPTESILLCFTADTPSLISLHHILGFDFVRSLVFVDSSLFAHHLTTACFFHDALLYGFGSVCLLFFNKAFTCNCSSLYNLTEIGWMNN